MDIFNRLNLQLFADGGADAPAGSEGTTPLATEGEKPAARVLYGKQAQVAEAVPPTQPQKTEVAEETFEQLINGKYKADYEAHLKSHLDRRLRNAGTAPTVSPEMQKILENTARSYGIDPKSKDLIEQIGKAQEADDEIYAKEAYARGLSVDAYKRELQKDERIEKLSAQVAENDRRAQNVAWVKSLKDQVPEVRKMFPNFNLDEEMENREFADLVRPGSKVTLEQAMYAIHHREILSGAVKTAAQTAAQNVANSVASNRARPKEGGLSATPQVVVKDDPSKWSKSDRAEVRRKVKNGEKIYL